MQRGAAPSAAHHEVTLDAAVDAARTGDVWIFRGRSHADRAIRLATNAPVNHVGMAVVLDDLPPMMWHAELGRSLTDMWTGDHHRGVQLHDLRAAVQRWTGPYRQQAWMRQLTPDVGREQEDAVLRTIARWDGTSFPSTTTLGWRWVRGRRWWLPSPPKRRHMWRSSDTQEAMTSSPETSSAAEEPRPAAAYCAEVVAVTYEAMGILAPDRPANWYDPGRFWSGDRLALAPGWVLGAEIAVRVDQPTPARDRRGPGDTQVARPSRWSRLTTRCRRR